MKVESIILLSFEQVVANWSTLESHLLWPRFEESYSVEWLQKQISIGHAQVWSLGEEIVVLTQVVVLPNGKRVLEITWAHGTNVDKYIELGFDTFQRFASFAGCERIDVRGRPGWARKLRRLPGVRVDYILSCPVPPVQKGN